MRLRRRSFLVSSITGFAAVPGYTRFLEPEWLEVTEKDVPLASGKLKRDLRLLHLSDLHFSSTVPLALIERAIELGLDRKPDLAFLTGDYITNDLSEPGEYSRVLRVLGTAVQTFACFGNHDGGSWAARNWGHPDTSAIQAVLENAGITCLKNDARVIQVHGQSLNVAGVGDLWAQEVDAARAFAAEIPVGIPTLLLAHNPDTRLRVNDYAWDLMLSGHTHGGQIVIPVVHYAPFMPVRDRRFAEGLQPWEGRYVHVTRGVGNILGVRLNCRPEVSLLTLKA
jgi:predicted MPP superfamily phosphohydrolase